MTVHLVSSGGRPHMLQTGRPTYSAAGPCLSDVCLVSHVNECEAGMQAVAGHICYVLAGLHVQPYGPASQVCLVGADHRSCPRRFATIPALQRSEVLEWARSQGRHSQISLRKSLLISLVKVSMKMSL